MENGGEITISNELFETIQALHIHKRLGHIGEEKRC
jgi:hypothetical protein